MKTLPALLFCLLLGGCASYEWRHPSDASANFDADSYQCQTDAAKLYPPMLRERTLRPPMYYPPRNYCNAEGRCNWTIGRWEPAETENYDANEMPRRELYQSCLKAKGWLRIRTK